MNFVYLLGAGASRHAKAPLMFDFFDVARRVSRAHADSIDREAFSDVFAGLAELRSVYARAYLELDNIEAFFGAIEMGLLIGRLADRSEAGIKRLRESLVTLIVETLEWSVEFPISDRLIQGTPPFTELVTAISQPRGYKHRHSFITFNYDLLLEVALARAAQPFDYGLSQNLNTNTIPLLKLHGSINWLRCPTCHEILPVSVPYAVQNVYYPGTGQGAMRLWSENRHQNHLGLLRAAGRQVVGDAVCQEPIDSPPVIVPPTWDKGQHHQSIRRIWEKAAQELRNAEQVVVIGYSLPEADAFFRFLFALGIDSPTHLERITVIDPTAGEHGAVRERFAKFLGRGIEARVSFIPKKFEDAIDVIQTLIAAAV